jgi:SpoIID/LytB domain protein
MKRPVVRLIGVAVALVVGAQLLLPGAAPSYPSANVELVGHGWGHGRGLGQWGSYGYSADKGWSHEQILDHYYGGTTMGSQGDLPMSVQLTKFTGRDAIAYQPRGTAVVPGAAPWSMYSVRVVRIASNRFEVYGGPDCDGPWTLVNTLDGPIRIDGGAQPSTTDHDALLRACEPDGIQRWLRGTLRVVDSGGSVMVNDVPTEQYLRGVVPRESPASWGSTGGMAALRSQAVAARSYATAESRSTLWKTCDTTACQVYWGVKMLQGSTLTPLEHANTDQAIAQTAGLIRRLSSGAVARTEFSSSTGGWTAGGTFPSVIDEGDSRSPYHDWTHSIPVSQIESKYPTLGTLLSVDVTQRNGIGDFGGRVQNLVLRGSAANVNLTGAAFQSAFGTRSTWFQVNSSGRDIAGDNPAVRRGNIFYLRDSTTTGVANSSFAFGDPGDVPMMCDWDGNGSITGGVFRGGAWYFRNSNSTGAASGSFGFGNPGDTPVCGDWDGNGSDTPGVVRGNTWYLRNANSTGPADGTFQYGNATDRKVVGSWNGGPYDTPGVVRGGIWYLRNNNFVGPADIVLAFGDPNDTPLVGDWNDDAMDTPAVRRGNVWYLRDTNTTGAADVSFTFGDPADRPLVWR